MKNAVNLSGSGKVEDYQYDIFLCHNRADKSWVHQLAQMIETEEYDGRTLKAFFDEWDIKPGENVVLRLNDALPKSRYIGVVLSQQMLDAEWPAMEWTTGVYLDPSGRRGLVIPIWRGGCEIPPTLKIRNVLYCRNEAETARSYAKLIALLKNEPMPRGGPVTRSPELQGIPAGEQTSFEYAEAVEEQLASNLFPVIKLPNSIWSAPTTAEEYSQVYDHFKTRITGTFPTFLLRNKRLFAFSDLGNKDSPFRDLLSADVIEQSKPVDWANNDEKAHWLIEMLNRSLKNYCRTLYLRYDKEHKRFFFMPYNGADRKVQWHTGERRATRTVAKKYRKGMTDETFWAHQSVKLRFLYLGKELFLEVNPGWTFTSDGRELLPPNELTSLSSKWMHDEYNVSVFYHIRFWSFVLSKGMNKISIPVGGSYIEVDITPAVAESKVGLSDDVLSIEKVFEAAEDMPAPDLLIEMEESEE